MKRRLFDLWVVLRSGQPLPLSPRAKRVLKVLIFLPLMGAVVGYAGLAYTATPRFCVMCHYMRPFYEAWETSSHNQVPCVQCHIPPGAKGFVRHKFAASVQLVKYVTRQYGTRPWTEVDDASCLRAGCHEARLLAGKVRFGGVEFDHGPHLTSFRRVTRLRCTSCHAQIVQGTHMTVTEGACFLCHFKNTPEAPEMANCRLCHKEIRPHRREDVSAESWVRPDGTAPLVGNGRRTVPPSSPPPAGGNGEGTHAQQPRYDHKLVLERGVDCRECHADVVQGQGEVPRDRCLVCHSEPERLNKYSDTEFMHRHHVTEHKVDCLRCHIEIRHQKPSAPDPGGGDCQSCHPNHHAQARNLYRGQGGHGTKATPNPMFATRVPCTGCHLTHAKVEGQGVNLRAGAAGCMNCHGEAYGKTLAEWQMKSVAWLQWGEAALAQTRAALKRKAAAGRAGEKVWGLYRQADENVRLVKYGHVVHNVDYAEALLRTAAAKLNQALALSGASDRVPPLEKAAPPAGGECLDCHYGVEAVRAQPFGVRFDHAPHLLRGHLKCQRCHDASLNPNAPHHGQSRLKPSDCRACHRQRRAASPHPAGWRTAHGPAVRRQAPAGQLPSAAPAECRSCHTQTECNRCHGLAMPHPSGWPVTHTRSARRDRTVCHRCHGSTDCRECHGLDLPHPPDWTRQLHQAAAKRNQALCRNCHTEWFCQSCHKIEMPHPAGWRQAHGSSAQAQPQVCAQCHDQPAECLACHQQKPPSSHGKGWNKRHGQTVNKAEEAACGLCHGSCLDCHRTPMPHPPDWILAKHGSEASYEKGSKCFSCHEPRYCEQCHEKSYGS